MTELVTSPIIVPVLGLVLWTLIVQAWMAATRVPAMNKLGLTPQSAQRTADLAGLLPKEVQWKADNYNHLMEQPTIFYAAALALAVAGYGDGLNLICAWAYVLIRVLHSIIQGTINNVTLRFSLFGLSTFALIAMVINGLIQMM